MTNAVYKTQSPFGPPLAHLSVKLLSRLSDFYSSRSPLGKPVFYSSGSGISLLYYPLCGYRRYCIKAALQYFHFIHETFMSSDQWIILNCSVCILFSNLLLPNRPTVAYCSHKDGGGGGTCNCSFLTSQLHCPVPSLLNPAPPVA